MLFGQHGINWIQEGLDDEGNILIFNNGNGKPGADCTQIEILTPPQSAPGFYTREDMIPFGPIEANTIYGDGAGETFYSAFLSNAFRLPNGNTLINSGSPGRIFEITPDREIVWEYEIPVNRDFPIAQGTTPRNNSSFRAYKYPLDFAGFDGVDVTPGDPIELNPLDCNLPSTSTTDLIDEIVSLAYLPQSHAIQIESSALEVRQIIISNINGQRIEAVEYTESIVPLAHEYVTGVYVANVVFIDGQVIAQKIFISQ